MVWPGAAIRLAVGGGRDRSLWRGARTTVWAWLAWLGPVSPLWATFGLCGGTQEALTGVQAGGRVHASPLKAFQLRSQSPMEQEGRQAPADQTHEVSLLAFKLEHTKRLKEISSKP